MTAEPSPFLDITAEAAPSLELWPAYLVSSELIDAEVDRLASLACPPNGRRQALIRHPMSTAPGLGLAPGIRVTLDVLLPGEHTDPIRHNSSQVNFCIRGSGAAIVAGRRIEYGRYDVWITPSLAVYVHENRSDGLQVRLTYSNAALLEKLNVHYVEEDPDFDRDGDGDTEHGPAMSQSGGSDNAGLLDEIHLAAEHPELDDDTVLTPYEQLINPPLVPQKSLHWPWPLVKEHLDRLTALGSAYQGRRLYLLYNPATGRTMGTTNSFFATMTVRPAGIVDRPHRHASAAINYFFSGRGNSIVGGRRYDWKKGDLMLTAPGWVIHRHASADEPVYELTVQDSPLHLAMDSLLWQEDLRVPLRLLGSHPGFGTNRATAVVDR